MPTVKISVSGLSARSVGRFCRCCRLQSGVIRSVCPLKALRCTCPGGARVTSTPFVRAVDQPRCHPVQNYRRTPCSRHCRTWPPAWQHGHTVFPGPLPVAGMVSVGCPRPLSVASTEPVPSQRRTKISSQWPARASSTRVVRTPHKRGGARPLGPVVADVQCPGACAPAFQPFKDLGSARRRRRARSGGIGHGQMLSGWRRSVETALPSGDGQNLRLAPSRDSSELES